MARTHLLPTARVDLDASPPSTPKRRRGRSWTIRPRIGLLVAGLFVGFTTAVGCDTKPLQIRVDGAFVEGNLQVRSFGERSPGVEDGGEGAAAGRSAIDHTRMLVRIKLFNPNNDSVALEEIAYRVGPYEGLRHPGISIPPNGESTLLLPAVMPSDAVGDTVSTSGRIAWSPTGVISRSLHDARVIRRRSSFGGSAEIASELPQSPVE